MTHHNQHSVSSSVNVREPVSPFQGELNMTHPENLSALSNNHVPVSNADPENKIQVVCKPVYVSKGTLIATGLFVLIAGYGYISERNRQKVEVLSPQPVQSPKRESLLNFYRDLRKDVEDKNEKAIQKFDIQVSNILNQFEGELHSIRVGFSGDISTYTNCTYLVYLMAYDKAFGSVPSYAEKFIHQELAKKIGPAFGVYSKKLEDAAEELKVNLYQNAFHYAMKVSQSGPDNHVKVQTPIIKNEKDFEMALQGLGFKAVINIPLLGLDFYYVIKSNTLRVILRMVSNIAARLFARPIAVAAGSAVIAAADGPLPAGDVLAIGGLIWTGWDIISARSQFETEISNTMQNLNQDTVRQITEDIQSQSRNLVTMFKNFCDELETSTIRKEINN